MTTTTKYWRHGESMLNASVASTNRVKRLRYPLQTFGEMERDPEVANLQWKDQLAGVQMTGFAKKNGESFTFKAKHGRIALTAVLTRYSPKEALLIIKRQQCVHVHKLIDIHAAYPTTARLVIDQIGVEKQMEREAAQERSDLRALRAEDKQMAVIRTYTTPTMKNIAGRMQSSLASWQERLRDQYCKSGDDSLRMRTNTSGDAVLVFHAQDDQRKGNNWVAKTDGTSVIITCSRLSYRKTHAIKHRTLLIEEIGDELIDRIWDVRQGVL